MAYVWVRKLFIHVALAESCLETRDGFQVCLGFRKRKGVKPARKLSNGCGKRKSGPLYRCPRPLVQPSDVKFQMHSEAARQMSANTFHHAQPTCNSAGQCVHLHHVSQLVFKSPVQKVSETNLVVSTRKMMDQVGSSSEIKTNSSQKPMDGFRS